MRRVAAFYQSTVGKKVAMALTGFILVGFVIGHMLGNLKAFQGAEKFNHYAEGLRELGAPFFGHEQFLWLFRIALIVSVGVHVLAATQLTLRAWRARPAKYHMAPHLELSYASRTMRWGGVIIATYVVYHLMHFTFGNAHPDFIPGDAYHNLVVGFQSPWVVAVYLVAVAMLTLHLYHGIWSALQTLGASHPTYNRWRRGVAAALALAVMAGFAAVPLSVFAGIIR